MEKKRKPKFKRTDFSKYSKLGVRRKRKQVYRKPKGIDNKIKLKMKGHVRRVMIGFKNNKKTSELVLGLEPVQIFNVADLNKLVDGKIGIVAKVGMKKKIEIAEKALKDGKRLFNLNSKKFLEKIKETEKIKEEKKSKREKKIKEKEIAAKKAEEKEAEEEKKEEDLSKKVDEKKESKSDEEKIVEKKSKNNKKDVQTNNYGRGK